MTMHEGHVDLGHLKVAGGQLVWDHNEDCNRNAQPRGISCKSAVIAWKRL